jgi:hypothetical protein
LGKRINSLIDLIGNLYALANKGHDTRALHARTG